MKAIFTNGKGGIAIEDIPEPKPINNSVLCKMTHSLISAGTEKMIITNTIGKTRDEILSNNIRLGYCGAGIVEDVYGGDTGLKKGDRVGYYGAPYTSHSEYVVIPKNLVVKIPDNVSSEEAAFIGLGAISLHGFKMGKCGLGEISLVSGAGIIGNICAQLSLISGCRLIFSDYNQDRIEILKKCIDTDKNEFIFVLPDKILEELDKFSESRGADSVFLCMATKSSEPMEQSVKAVRRGGRIIIVGVLDIHLPREDFFEKEAEITISRAGGPGRYDSNYERESID